MNYGRTTKTTTHRDTPLSRTPEPMFFQDLPEVIVRANANQKLANNVSIGNADDRKKSSLKALRQIKNNYIGGPRDLEEKIVPKKKKKWLTEDNAIITGVLGGSAGILGKLIYEGIEGRKWKKYQRDNSSPYDDNIVYP
jgi:hypothetical protein